MGTQIDIKRGQSLNCGLQFNNDDGTPANLSASTITSQVRDYLNTLVASLSIVVTGDGTAGAATMAFGDTSGWPPGVLRCDIKVVTSGVVQFSETFSIQVGRSVTQ